MIDSHTIFSESKTFGNVSNDIRIERKQGQPPPYHIYSYLGEFFLFDTSTQLIYRIDETVFRLLELCLNGLSIEEAGIYLQRKAIFSKDIIEEVLKELSVVAQSGLFEIPDYRMTDEELEERLVQDYEQPIHSITLGVTESCNLSCIYCYCGDRCNASTKMMTKEVARQSLDWLFKNAGNHKTLSVCFFGGEPLLNKEVIRFATEYGEELATKVGKKILFSMTTNATLIDDEFADFIQTHKIRTLVSLDGPKEIHDAQCPTKGGAGSFEMASAGAKRILAFQKNSNVRATLTHPIKDISKLIDFFQKFGFGYCTLGPTTNPEETQGDYDFTEDDYFELYTQEGRMIPAILQKRIAGEPIFYDPFDFYIREFKRNNRKIYAVNCGAANACLYINVDGTLYPCHHHYSYESWKLGNVFEDSPVNIEKLKDYWRKYQKNLTSCETCWAGALCPKPCSADMIRQNGTFDSKIRFCDSMRFRLEQAGYIYCLENQCKEKQPELHN